jgi:beta-galactosidase
MRISVGGINYLDSGTSAYTGLHNGIDREALVHLYEINGLDNFMQPVSTRVDEQLRYYNNYNEKAYSLRWLGHTILLDFIRSLGPGKLIYDSEWHSVSSVYYVNPEPPSGYMHTSLWLSALHGLGATRTWYWCRNANGSIGRSQEEFYGSLLVQPRLLNEYGVGLAELNAFGKEVVALERAPKQIYLLYSESSAIQSKLYLGNQMRTYESLQFTGFSIGFVTENELAKTGLPSGCKWLIIPDDSYVSLATLEWLHNYKKGGGKLLVIGNNALKFNEHGDPYSTQQLEFMSGVDRFDPVAPTDLLGKLEEYMTKTEVKRAIRCTESTGKQTAYGVLCRAVEYEGGHLVCLINVAASPREVSLDLNGKPVKSAVDLFDNKSVKTKTINIQPLTVRLFKVSK